MRPTAEQIKLLSAAPILLIACDFDGTLAPIAEHPSQVAPHRTALGTLQQISAMRQTFAGVVSGRALADLKERLGPQPRVRLIGSHGGESHDGRLLVTPSGAMLEKLASVRAEVSRLADSVPGAWAEVKPLGVAVHYRQASDEAARPMLDAIERTVRGLEGVRILHGKRVVEMVVGGGDKGLAILNLKHATAASHVLFVGDDATDEDAFGVLGPLDLSVKVGPGESKAAFRVESPDQVAELLEEVFAARSAYLASRVPPPIESLRLLSDQRACGLVDANGRVVWLCLPRIDSPPVFAELLGGPSRGFWEVVAADCATPPRQTWLEQSWVLETTWGPSTTSEQAMPLLRVTDYLDTSMGRGYQRAGRSDVIRVLSGTGRAIVRFAPRLDFGRVSTRLRVVDHGLEVVGGQEPLMLYSPDVIWTITDEGPHQTAIAEVPLAGREIVLELRHGTLSCKPAAQSESERRGQTVRSWSSWSHSLRLPERYRPHVERSALVLKALCQGPTGAIAAAGTTSLPEQLGGVRNWDYRYCWPRDGAMSAAALVRLGNTGIAMRFLDFLAGIVASLPSPDRLRPIYDVAGHDLGSEAEISELSGYAQSRPVRIGNAAAAQVQLDVFGPIVDLAALVAERGAPVTPEVWRLVESMVRAVTLRWREPDQGVWEIRAPARHHVHSKIMCYHAVDRALVVADLALGHSRPEWAALRDDIARDVLEHAWSEELQAYAGFYGGRTLDTAVLLMAGTSLVSSAPERFALTVDAINKTLRQGPVVRRYIEEDGLPGEEGGMLICACWLVEAMTRVGRASEARELLDQVVAVIPPSGLMSEQIEPETHVALGNTPQAYSHLGLINAVLCLEKVGETIA